MDKLLTALIGLSFVLFTNQILQITDSCFFKAHVAQYEVCCNAIGIFYNDAQRIGTFHLLKLGLNEATVLNFNEQNIRGSFGQIKI
jgi:hypothetical protein